MSDSYLFWTHGVSVQVEYTDAARGLRIRRAGHGTSVSQNAGTWNWFHFDLRAGAELDDEGVKVHHAWLRCLINNYAVIEQVTVHQAAWGQSPRIFETPEPGQPGALNLTDCTAYEGFDIPNRNCVGPLVLCVRVRFESDEGEVVFHGAGVQLEEQ